MVSQISLFLLLTTVSFTIVNSYKVYDIEAESLQLFGESFSRVLKRFRRTPEYVKILRDKTDSITTHIDDIVEEIMGHYSLNVIKDTVQKILGNNDTTTIQPTYRRFVVKKRQGFKNNWPNMKKLNQRASSEEVKKSKKDPIKELDNHPAFHSLLTLTERNECRNQAFALAGDLIHEMIKGFGADKKDDKAPASTLVSGAKSTKMTTEHPDRHTITVTLDADQEHTKSEKPHEKETEPKKETEKEAAKLKLRKGAKKKTV